MGLLGRAALYWHTCAEEGEMTQLQGQLQALVQGSLTSWRKGGSLCFHIQVQQSNSFSHRCKA